MEATDDPQARLSATLQAPRLVGSMLKCCACFAAKNHPSRQGSRDETAERHSLTAMPRHDPVSSSTSALPVSPSKAGHAAKPCQDRGIVHWPFNGSENEALLCVFDGHGKNGERVADLVMNELPSLLQERAAELRAEPKKTLITAVEQIDTLVLARDGGEFAKECGTTSTVQGCTLISQESVVN
ncbi:hypothetical protein EMIHUDRAFT_255131 [Emiliania huxleyi CCMP1516]|uniref:PPM-type phosphatase domain-containing protein n=2 Tax=Emiliania huxleyi TaxID=2903 RepID=A0A0D3JFQ8_EMIH1|nr:hypothetical protein EMIHUDRAFT_255131 [Emiliania huxleyi CCMP1516]EOD22343.1 hypothetical protein EMIHUDRAFT_255131 [Emiliania huxleyi CCMP1516]|eukprot:XP_005774772.1 hypothetical protein EMIHUDRAFT_255131 [Emiliania huxleyi CCMP1516]